MTPPAELTAELVARAWPDVEGELLGFYRWLHAHPELSTAEHATAAALAQRLRGAGFEVTEGVGGTGVVGVLRNGDGPTVLLRGDMDALPVAERTGLEWAATGTAVPPGGGEPVPVMHACGHDVHVACLAGTAELLAAHRDAWSGTVVACGQPAEETAQGARAMVEDGLFTRFPRPDVCLGQHVSSAGEGLVEHLPGPFMAAAASIEITLHGRGGHASQPEVTVDPVVLGSYLVTRLQAVVSRETAPSESAVLSVPVFHAGAAHNVVPDTATLTVNLRSRSQEGRDRLVEAVRRTVDAEVAASRAAPASVRVFSDFPVLVNDPGTTEDIAAAHAGLAGIEVVPGHPRMGSEDFGEFARPGPGGEPGVPVVYWCFGLTGPAVWDAAAGGTREERMTRVPVAHTGHFAPASPERTVRRGVELLLCAALCRLGRGAGSGAR